MLYGFISSPMGSYLIGQGQDHVGNVDVDHLTLAWRSIEWMRVGSKDAPRSMFVCDLYFGLRVICCKLNIA